MGVVVLVAGIAMFLFLRQGKSNAFPSRVPLLCVESGEVLQVARSKVTRYPAENPKTGRRTLLPFHEGGGGKFIPERYQAYVKRLDEQEVNHYVDVKTLKVRE